jgi:hypothetical protein
MFCDELMAEEAIAPHDLIASPGSPFKAKALMVFRLGRASSRPSTSASNERRRGCGHEAGHDELLWWVDVSF